MNLKKIVALFNGTLIVHFGKWLQAIKVKSGDESVFIFVMGWQR
jgi:hypothetical protein